MFNLHLDNNDLFLFQNQLETFLKKFLDFKQLKISFTPPASLEPSIAKHSDQVELILHNQNQFIGRLIFTQCTIDAKTLAKLPQIILTYLAACKQDVFLPTTNSQTYLEKLCQQIITSILNQLQGLEETLNNFYNSLHLLLLRIENPVFSHIIYDQVWAEINSTITQLDLPWKVFNYNYKTLAIPLFNCGIKKTKEVVQKIWKNFNQTLWKHPISNRSLPLQFSLGLASFPKHFLDQELRASPNYLFAKLQEKALLALDKSKQFNEPFTYDQIKTKGGQITEILSSNQVKIDLGSLANLKKGDKFVVFQHKKLKAEIEISQIAPEQSEAKIVFQNPLLPLQKGDRLQFKSYSNPSQTPETSLFQHASSLVKTKGMVNLTLLKIEELHAMPKAKLCKLIESIWTNYHLEQIGFNLFGLISAEPREELKTKLLQLETSLHQENTLTYLGASYHPLANFKLNQLVSNAYKALDHAFLLSKRPFIAIFDSTSLTISGDKFFRQNEFYQAIQEYHQALLLDPKNVLALNSLGVIQARLGHLLKAKEYFLQTLEIEPNNEPAMYNLARILDQLQEKKQAKAYYLKCKTYPYQGYGLLRIGMILEEQGKVEQARSYFVQAQEYLAQHSQPHTLLADSYLKTQEVELAKEELHTALLKNPNDAKAFYLLAKIYWQEKNDPQLVLSLARQSLALRPDVPEFWNFFQKVSNLNQESDFPT